MAHIKINAGELHFRLAQDEKRIRKAIKQGAKKAARKSKSLLKQETPVDLGNAKEAWGVFEEEDKIILNNAMPYIDILDRGARAHPVSVEGQQLILEWIYRHISVKDDKEANTICFLICRKIREQGVEGKNFISETEEERFNYLDEAMKEAVAILGEINS